MRAVVRRFHRVDVKNGEATSFQFDQLSSLGRLAELLGTRGFIDLGIPITSTVAEAMHNHRRRRRHRLDIFNKVEDEIENLKHENHQEYLVKDKK